LTAGLTPDHLALVEAIVARLIPSDENGPGAAEARVARYIEHALATEYARHQGDYVRGLADVDRRASSTYGAGFRELALDEQDAVLTELEASPFFELVRQHALEGMFGDPAHGGNADRIGWKLLGYEGPKLVWTEEEQQLGGL
jgi:gluconate 2-dehydrogenase gamma chain